MLATSLHDDQQSSLSVGKEPDSYFYIQNQ